MYVVQSVGRPDQVYHVAVMMCYDKKLEASREDFFNDVYRTRDVDCVITTGTVVISLDYAAVDHGLNETPREHRVHLCPQASWRR